MKKLALLAILLSGCASAPPWNHDEMDPQQFNRDDTECKYEAHKAVPDYGYGNVFTIAIQRTSIYNQCMQVKGYYR